jgi:hypothetical protein
MSIRISPGREKSPVSFMDYAAMMAAHAEDGSALWSAATRPGADLAALALPPTE